MTAREFHPSYGYLSADKWRAACETAAGGAQQFKATAGARLRGARSAATRKEKAARIKAAKEAAREN